MIGMIHMIPISNEKAGPDLVKVSRNGRICYTEEQRRKALELFEQSGMNAKEFAEAHDIKYPTFIRWNKAHRDSMEKDSRNEQSFVLAELGTPSPQQESITLTLPNGFEIKASNDSGVNLLAQLINKLGKSC